MANIAVRKENGNRNIAQPTVDWEPGRLMRSLLSWDPFREMAPYFQGETAADFMPDFEVKETKDAYLFKADVPGVKEADLDVTVTGNRLTISGKREAEHQEKGDTFYTYERSYGSFTRAFTLPDGIDANNVRADLKDGVLNVSLPKKPELQAKKIDIKTPATKS